MVKSTPAPLITSIPLTAEARESLLHDLFAGQLPHYGELFIPRDSFYNGQTVYTEARNMLKALCTWLGIKPGYIGLEFESLPQQGSQAGQRYDIFIESLVMRDEFLLAATIANALTRYLLEEQKQMHLQTDEQRAMTATATVVFGLGVVMANGLKHSQHDKALLGSLPASEYAAMLHGFLRQRSVPPHMYNVALAPWAAELLGVKPGKRKIRVVEEAYQKRHMDRLKLVGFAWFLFIAICTGGFLLFQRVQPESIQAKTARQHMELLEYVSRECRRAHNYNKQYTDTTDILAQRSLNAEEARCRSLENEYKNAVYEYQKLTND